MSNRSRLFQAQLFGLAAIFFFAILFFLVLHNWRQSRLVHCDTASCRQISEEINGRLNPNVSACKDFALHVCGKQQNFISNTSRTYHMATMQFILDYYNENGDKFSKIPLFDESINFYKSCNNPDQRNDRFYNVILDLLESIGGFPLLKEDWSPEDFHFDKALILLHKKIKRNFIIEIEIRQERQAKFIHVKKYETIFNANRTWISEYKELIRRSLEIISEDEFVQSNERIEPQLMDLVYFEHRFHNITFDVPLNIDFDIFNITTFEPIMDWSSVIQSMINDTSDFLMHYQNVISIGRDAVRHLNKLLDDKRTFANYLCWKIVQHFSPYSTMNLLQLHLNFAQKTRFIEDKSNEDSINYWNQGLTKWTLLFKLKFSNGTLYHNETTGLLAEICARQTLQKFQNTFDYLFQEYFTEKGVEKFNGMLNKLLVVFQSHLENTKWSDSKFNSYVQQKIQSINLRMALAKSSFSSFCYGRLEPIDLKNFTSTVVHVEIFNYFNQLCVQSKREEALNILKMNRGKKWDFDVHNRNTLPPNNILEAPNFWLMAKFGSVIGRYLVNIFYNETVRNHLSYRAYEIIKERLKCFENKLAKDLPIDLLSLNEKDSFIEKYVSQTEGVNLAYKMFNTLLTSGNRNRNVDGFQNLNLRQLFFISYVNGYCHYISGKQQNAIFHHLINFSVFNSPYFQEVFKCPIDYLKKTEDSIKIETQDGVCTLF